MESEVFDAETVFLAWATTAERLVVVDASICFFIMAAIA